MTEEQEQYQKVRGRLLNIIHDHAKEKGWMKVPHYKIGMDTEYSEVVPLTDEDFK
jgi:hypothetical protein